MGFRLLLGRLDAISLRRQPRRTPSPIYLSVRKDPDLMSEVRRLLPGVLRMIGGASVLFDRTLACAAEAPGLARCRQQRAVVSRTGVAGLVIGFDAPADSVAVVAEQKNSVHGCSPASRRSSLERPFERDHRAERRLKNHRPS